MGIILQSAKILLFENSFKRFSGKLLSLGKHTVALKEKDFLFFEKYGYCFDFSLMQKDNSTRHRFFGGISDKAFFEAISSKIEYNCIDISNYEGANIVCNLCYDIPQELYSMFDIVYNWSVFDNIFDPITGLKNTTKMIKPGGRIIHVEAMSNILRAYLHFTPEWFYSYYAINNFKDCKIYFF